MSTYRLFKGFFEAEDLGRAGGGGPVPRKAPAAGVGGAEADVASSGTRFDLIRGTVFLGGDVRSTAEAGRGGGGPGGMLGVDIAPERPGEAVCDRFGGARGVAALGGSAPAWKLRL